MEDTQIRQRVLTSTFLEYYQIFAPKNIDSPPVDDSLITWGFLNDIYPDAWKILIENSPTATSVINRLADFVTCNLDKKLRSKLTTLKNDWSNTLGNQMDNIARDMLTWDDSFAVWLGFDPKALKEGRVVINEFKRLPIHWLRYFVINEKLKDFYGISDDFFIAQKSTTVGDRDNKRNSNSYDLYFPFNRNGDFDQILRQMKVVADSKEGENSFDGLLPLDSNLKFGQILWINNSDEQMYPNCKLDGLLQAILSDIGLDTGIAAYLANAPIAQTYIKNEASSGAEMANTIRQCLGYYANEGGISQAQMLGLGNFFKNYFRPDLNAGDGSGFGTAGVKGMGVTKSVRIQDNESIGHFVHQPDCAKFMDEFEKMQKHINRKIANRFQVPYEYLFEKTSGVLNQENQEMMLKELNLRFDKNRDLIENVFNEWILPNSVWADVNNGGFRIELKGFGEDKEEVNSGIDEDLRNEIKGKMSKSRLKTLFGLLSK